jgi:hypothetical protein
MKTTHQSTLKEFSLKNRSNWSGNRYAWFYAIIILLASLILGLVLYTSEIYESMALRSINIFFILIGFYLMIRDYRRHKSEALSYVDAFLLCARTGFYYLLLYLPVILIFLGTNQSEVALVMSKETFGGDFSIIEIVFTTYLETVAITVVCGIAIAFTSNLGKKS